MVLVRVPASSANLGPGFDCLGVALELYNYIEILEANAPLKISLTGTYRDGFALDENNLVYQAAKFLWQKIGFNPSGIALNLINNIPPSRGLGSSSAAIVGGLYSANLLAGSPLDKEELLALAADLEGHPDNVAAALYGGVALAIRQPSGNCISRSLGNMEGLKIVVAIPDMSLPTKLARSLLPGSVSMADAVWNLSRTGLLVTSLLNEDYSLLKVAMEDHLHEQYRAKAIPGMDAALAAAKEAGALGAVLSGAGPTMISFVPDFTDETLVGEAMYNAFLAVDVRCEIRHLYTDRQGTVQLETLPQELQDQNFGGPAC